ncbi:hypothetical protein [Streptomyces griseoflavus]|uniref:hypothetical protein n=1 Tax=Streptomyces griseoflavus TaxID=35619 RepID=UPI0033DD641A
MNEAQVLRTGALITAAALRGDDMAVELLVGTLPADHVRIVAVAAVGAMAGLVREAITPEAVQQAVRDAQTLAHTAAQEGTQT